MGWKLFNDTALDGLVFLFFAACCIGLTVMPFCYECMRMCLACPRAVKDELDKRRRVAPSNAAAIVVTIGQEELFAPRALLVDQFTAMPPI